MSDAIEGRGGTQYEMPKQSVEDIIEKIKLGKNIGGELHYSGKWIDKTKILI